MNLSIGLMEGIPQVVYVAPIRNFDENTQQIKKKGITQFLTSLRVPG